MPWPWWPSLLFSRRGCRRCGAMHDSSVLDLARPSWCSLCCMLADEQMERDDPAG
jgi:hypothetical protein